MGGDATAVLAAVITAGAAVVAVVVAQVATGVRETRHRERTRERQALLDVQDAALVVRSALRASGSSIGAAVQSLDPSTHLRVDAPEDVDAARSDADGRLDVRLARVATREVVDSVRTWQQQARYAFLGDEDVTARDEQRAWEELNDAVARALGGGTRRRRS